jgi:hypothetical protein
MVWTNELILKELRRLHKAGADLSYNGLAKKKQSLVSAAAYHFGSYRAAIEAAKIDYAQVLRRPRWTRAEIIKLIKAASRDGKDLHWSAVTLRRDQLGRAAFASLQTRLFGNWHSALNAAGLDGQFIAKYRRWDRESIITEIRKRVRLKKPINSGGIQRRDPGLHAAAMRHFGSFDAALRAAKIDPLLVRQRKNWSEAEVIHEIKALSKDGASLSDSAVRRASASLYGAAVRIFGTFIAARKAAGVKFAPNRTKSKFE